MPVDLQNLQNLSAVTDFDQLKLGANNSLTRRSGIETFFRKVGDAFLKLSQAGRTAIAHRNERIMNAMRAAMHRASSENQPEAQNVAQRLNSAITRIQVANLAPRFGLSRDPRFRNLPPASQLAQCQVLHNTASEGGGPAALQQLKNDFFGVRPAEYDMAEGMRRFSEELSNEFLKPVQQSYVDDSGIHDSFVKDTHRGSVSRIGQTLTPGGQEREVYETALRNEVPAQHHRFLPFISMMASQAGMDSAMTFLPMFARLSDMADSHLMQAGLAPTTAGTTHDISVVRNGSRLVLTSTFDQAYKMHHGSDTASVVLRCKGTVTMNIDLDAEPRREVVNGKEVLIPQFTIENGDVYFETPAA